MKWVSIKRDLVNLAEYELVIKDHVESLLKYNPIQHTARISCNETQRLFFLRRIGFAKNKVLFTDEYGIPVGLLNRYKWNNDRYKLTIEGKKYLIHYENTPLALVIVNDQNQQVAACSLQTHRHPGIELKAEENTEISSLLFGICWYLSHSSSKNNSVEFATNSIVH